jgi:hypothetical protein
MRICKLLTREGGLVATVQIPEFNPPAEGLIWGTRFFVPQQPEPVRLDNESGQMAYYYIEGMLYYVTQTAGVR